MARQRKYIPRTKPQKPPKTIGGFAWNNPPRCVACEMPVSLLTLESVLHIPGNGYLCEFCQGAAGFSEVTAEMVACKTVVTATVFLALFDLCANGRDHFARRFHLNDKAYTDRLFAAFRSMSDRRIGDLFASRPCSACRDVANVIRHDGHKRRMMPLLEAVKSGAVQFETAAGATGFRSSGRACDCPYCRGLLG